MSSITIGQIKKNLLKFTRIDPNGPIKSTHHDELMKMVSVLALLLDLNDEKHAELVEKVKEVLRPFKDVFPKHREYAHKQWEHNMKVADDNFARVEWELRDGN